MFAERAASYRQPLNIWIGLHLPRGVTRSCESAQRDHVLRSFARLSRVKNKVGAFKKKHGSRGEATILNHTHP